MSMENVIKLNMHKIYTRVGRDYKKEIEREREYPCF